MPSIQFSGKLRNKIVEYWFNPILNQKYLFFLNLNMVFFKYYFTVKKIKPQKLFIRKGPSSKRIHEELKL